MDDMKKSMKLLVPILAVATLMLSSCTDRERRNATIQRMNEIESAIASYETECGSLKALDASTVFSELTGGNVKKIRYISNTTYESDRFLDGWGRPLDFKRMVGGKIMIHSLGSNGIMDSAPNSDDLFSNKK
jgi:hypothetical protein